MANDWVKAVRCQNKYKSGCMMAHVMGCPGGLAGLLHSDEVLVKERLQFLRDTEEVLSDADVVATSLMKEMTSGQGYASQAMRRAFKALGTTDYETVPPELREVLVDMFSGLLNSRLSEDINQQQREMGQRATLN